jgi:hypothetical protein
LCRKSKTFLNAGKSRLFAKRLVLKVKIRDLSDNSMTWMFSILLSFCLSPFELFFTLVGWLFIVLRPAQEYFTYMETSPLPVKDCKFKPMLGTQGL